MLLQLYFGVFLGASYTYTRISMTSLLAPTVAQPTKQRFLPKNLSHLVIFVIELANTWSWVNKNYQNLIFKINFLCQKISFIILILVSVKVFRLGEQLVIKPFFDNLTFWSSLFSEIGPYYCGLVIKWTQVQSQK